ncbi:MAG: IclR family transcriptional regulator [Burkholderiaceae bacterium]
MPSASPQSVQRIMTILRQLATHPDGLGLAELARQLDAPKSSLVGLLAGLTEEGYIVRTGDSYRIGREMFMLSTQVMGNLSLLSLLMPSLNRLASLTGETALAGHLAPDGRSLIYFAKVESANPVRYTAPVGKREELYSTAMGKLLLAYLDDASRQRYLAHCPFQSFTPNTITRADTLLDQLNAIRRSGVSITTDERVKGASAIAMPLVDARGAILCGIGLAGPTERMTHARAAQQAALADETQVLQRLVIGLPAESLHTL